MPADLFESAYLGTPPWDIGRSQPAIMRLAETGQITGLVLDIGCGTGENVLYLAAWLCCGGNRRRADRDQEGAGQSKTAWSRGSFRACRRARPRRARAAIRHR